MKLDKRQTQFVEELLHGKGHVILTGKAGTGKSVALIKGVKACIGAGYDVMVLAPTAMAASIHRDGGLESGTIHHALRWNPMKEPLSRKMLAMCAIDLEWDATPDEDRLLIIDEASMVGLWLFEVLARGLGTTDVRPFDGRRLVLVGDWAQLPPVVGKSELEEAKAMPELTAFGPPDGCILYHRVFRENPPVAVILDESHRANSEWFTSLNLLRDCNKKQALPAFRIKPPTIRESMGKNRVHMCFRRVTAHKRNNECLAGLPGRQHVVNLRDGNMALKEGCDVIVTSNRTGGGYINGSRAIFSGVNANGEIVLDGNNNIKMQADGNWARGTLCKDKNASVNQIEADQGVHKAERMLKEFADILEDDAVKWLETLINPDYAAAAVKFANNHIRCIPYFPILAGYALTVHKAQGMTLEGVIVEEDVFWSFAPARLPYVALSRVSSSEEVVLGGFSPYRAVVRPDKAYPAIIKRIQGWVRED